MPHLSTEQRQQIADRLRRARHYAAWDSSRSALAYLQHVTIDAAGGPRPFREAADPWQWTLLSRLTPALESVAGVRAEKYHGPRSFWLTMPRGHDKTTSVGRLTAWALAFSRKPLRAVACAADKDQAGLLAEFMEAEARLNPWLHARLQFKNWRVHGTGGSRLKILSADAASSYGLKEDLFVLDELTHWPKRDLWNAVVSGREKRPDSVLVIITNAGTLPSWQRDVFEQAKVTPGWYVFEAPGQMASWMSPEKIAQLRKLLPPGLARRLYDNKWVDASEDSGFVTRSEAELCVDPNLNYRTEGLRQHQPFVASVDYGPVRDRTVCCVCHCDDLGRVVLDKMDVFEGKNYAGRRVPIEVVERWLQDTDRAFFRPAIVLDPYQMESTAQRFEGSHEVIRFEARGGKANYELASNLRNLIVNRKAAWYATAGELFVDGRRHTLVDEIAETLIKVMSYGFRLDHETNKHDDRVIAYGMAALELVKGQGRIEVPTSERWF